MLRAVRQGEGHFVLPEVDAVASLPPNALRCELVKLAGLTIAIAARLLPEPADLDNPADGVDEAEAVTLLKLKSPRWLRSAAGKRLRCSNKVAGQWRYSRRKIARFLRGESLE